MRVELECSLAAQTNSHEVSSFSSLSLAPSSPPSFERFLPTDGLGRRVQLVDTVGSAPLWTRYVYGGLGVLQDETGHSTGPVDTKRASYVYAQGAKFAKIAVDLFNGQTTRTFYLTDHLGSTRAVIGADGAVVEEIAGGTTEQYRYTGKRKDASGLYPPQAATTTPTWRGSSSRRFRTCLP